MNLYEKKYKEAQKWIESIYPNLSHEQQMEAEAFFPELAENEDDRIRKVLVEHFDGLHSSTYPYKGFTKEEILAWLEKQGKQDFRERYKKIAQSEWFKQTHDGMSIGDVQEIEPTDINPSEFDLRLNQLLMQFESLPKEELASSLSFYLNVVQNNGTYNEEKQADKSGDYVLVNQKPANKIKPKFRVGDWVVSPNGVYWHIDAIQNGRYEVTADTGQCGNWPLDTNIYRLWTIQDAKDGDVLASEDNCICIFDNTVEKGKYPFAYCGLSMYGFKVYDRTLPFTHDNVYPATKEQRDLLFQKMKESGYEWDAEKKELKLLITNGGDFGPTWSEEDEKIALSIEQVMNCASLLNIVPEKVDKIRTWLKSLKQKIGGKQ